MSYYTSTGDLIGKMLRADNPVTKWSHAQSVGDRIDRLTEQVEKLSNEKSQESK